MRSIAFILIILFLVSCGSNKQDEQQNQVNPDKYLQDLEDANQYYTLSESDQIDDYADRMGWKMEKSGTGLRYLVYENGTGRQVEDKLVVRFEFKVNLLNGVTCYDSDKSGPREIWIGHADVESGLEEGLQLLREGDRAKFILPSHLAYGWLGDSDQIPTRAVLIYDVHVLEVRDYVPETY